MTEITEAEAAFMQHVLAGWCPCCFEYWEYGSDLSSLDLWRWQDKYDAWKVFVLLNEEENND